MEEGYMNTIVIEGDLAKDDGRSGMKLDKLYWLSSERKSGTMDRLMVFVDGIVPDGRVRIRGKVKSAWKSGTMDRLMVLADGIVPDGRVRIRGKVKSAYLRGAGVPTFIEAESVEPIEGSGTCVSEAVVDGMVRSDPVCRKIEARGGDGSGHGAGKHICTLLLQTDGGTVPAVLWGKDAESAPGRFRPGDMVRVSGRLQSRRYHTKEGGQKTAYSLSVYRIEAI